MATVTTLADAKFVGDNEEQLVTMIVDNQLFGIPILQVQDIVEASKITPVPLAPSAIAGVLNLRGRIVTVIDLRKLMGNHEEVPWDSQMGVTVEYKGDLYTLLVDAIGDVRSLAKRDYDKTPSTMEAEVKRLCSGIYRLRGNLLVVLDVGRILKHDVISATPMLTVEERKKRKAEAMQTSSGEEGRARQLSALMNDLRAYEAENAEAQRLAGTDDARDDMKSRKKANRTRRPVADRWQEVLSERERQQGKVVYRMREPDEETLEDARHEDNTPDAAPVERDPTDESETIWQARIRSGDAEDRRNEPAEQHAHSDEFAHLDEIAAADEHERSEAIVPADEIAAADEHAHSDETAHSDEVAAFEEDAEPATDADSGESSSGISGWWNKLRGRDASEAAEADDLPPEVGAEKPQADDELKAVDDEAPAQADDGESEATETAAKKSKPSKPASKASKSGKTAKSSSKGKSSPKGKKK